MLLQARRSACMHIADEADLQRDSLVQNILSEIPQFHRSTVRDGDVLNEPRAVANPVRPAILNRLPDGFLAKAYPGVHPYIEVLAANVVKSVDVSHGRGSSI